MWTVALFSLALVNRGSRRPHWRILETPSPFHQNGKKSSHLLSNSRVYGGKGPLKGNRKSGINCNTPCLGSFQNLLARSNLTVAVYTSEKACQMQQEEEESKHWECLKLIRIQQWYVTHIIWNNQDILVEYGQLLPEKSKAHSWHGHKEDREATTRDEVSLPASLGSSSQLRNWTTP